MGEKVTVRVLPEVHPRVESGVTRHGGDWCGVFVRGDECLFYGQTIDALLKHGVADPIAALMLGGLRDLLLSADERTHPKSAEKDMCEWIALDEDGYRSGCGLNMLRMVNGSAVSVGEMCPACSRPVRLPEGAACRPSDPETDLEYPACFVEWFDDHMKQVDLVHCRMQDVLRETFAAGWDAKRRHIESQEKKVTVPDWSNITAEGVGQRVMPESEFRRLHMTEVGVCPHCDGAGRKLLPSADGRDWWQRCYACEGTGMVMVSQDDRKTQSTTPVDTVTLTIKDQDNGVIEKITVRGAPRDAERLRHWIELWRSRSEKAGSRNEPAVCYASEWLLGRDASGDKMIVSFERDERFCVPLYR